MYDGIYNGKKKHDNDLGIVMERAKTSDSYKLLITGTSLSESNKAIQLARKYGKETQYWQYIFILIIHIQIYSDFTFATVGCHPTMCNEFEDEATKYLEGLLELALENKDKVKAIGECGLDYDRLHFCSAEIQKK